MVLPWCAVADSGGCLLGKADEPHTITQQQQQHTLEKSTTQYTVHWVWNCTLHFTVSSSRHYHTQEKSTTPHRHYHTLDHTTQYILHLKPSCSSRHYYTVYYTLCMKLHISKHHTAADTTTRWTPLHSKLINWRVRQKKQKKTQQTVHCITQTGIARSVLALKALR